MRCRPAILLTCALAALLLAGLPYARAGSEDDVPKAKSAAAAESNGPPPRPSPPAEPTGPARAGSLRKLGQRLDDLALRIAKVIEEARRDPDEALIDIYLTYTLKELKNRKRQVRAKHLVAIMVDPKNSKALRDKAREALSGGTLRGDIELSATSKKRGMTERAHFCRTEVVEHLKHDDREARRMTNLLLTGWYRVNTVPAILGYKYDDKKTWGRAVSAWIKELKRL